MARVKRVVVKRNPMTGDDSFIEVEVDQYDTIDKAIATYGEFRLVDMLNQWILEHELRDARRVLENRIKSDNAVQNT